MKYPRWVLQEDFVSWILYSAVNRMRDFKWKVCQYFRTLFTSNLNETYVDFPNNFIVFNKTHSFFFLFSSY